MPNSKRRKRLVASNKKQIERARRRIEAHSHAEANKENATTVACDSAFVVECNGSGTAQDTIEDELHRETNQYEAGVDEQTAGWLGGLYSWCHSGIVQVRSHVTGHK